MREIYIRKGSPRHIALLEDGALCEYLLDDVSDAAAEAIYLGRVERTVPGMQAAFVDIGQEKNGFLPFSERSKTAQMPPMRAGDRVLVQIKKEAAGTKGAFLSRDITLCGHTVILMPLNRYVGVSSRITAEEDRAALVEMGRGIAQNRFGLIMRQAALNDAPQTVEAEVDALTDKWESIARQAPTAHAPSLIHQPRTQLESLLDDYRSRGIDRIVTDDPQLVQELAGEAKVILAGDNAFAAARIGSQLEKALRRHVWLDSGASLVIDYCEAMHVIDVNTAKFTGRKDVEQTILQTNLEACGEIARQVRLRNLSGIIIIDMIDMNNDAHRAQVLQALAAAFEKDRVKTVIHGFTSLGLIEMTRKKTRIPLRDEWTAPCHACRGTGREMLTKEEQHG